MREGSKEGDREVRLKDKEESKEGIEKGEKEAEKGIGKGREIKGGHVERKRENNSATSKQNSRIGVGRC